MTSVTLRNWSATRFARWLVSVVAVALVATALSTPAADADEGDDPGDTGGSSDCHWDDYGNYHVDCDDADDPGSDGDSVAPGRTGCPSGINRPGCTHYYINHRGQQVPRGNGGRGLMVGGSEVRVLSWATVQVTTAVRVSPDRYAFRTSTLLTYKTVTKPSRQELVRTHKLTAAATSTIMSTVRWASNPTQFTVLPVASPGDVYYINSTGRRVNSLQAYGSRIRVVSRAKVEITTRFYAGCTRTSCPYGLYYDKKTMLRTQVRAGDKRIITTPSLTDLKDEHALSQRVAENIWAVARGVFRGRADYASFDRDGNETAGRVPGGVSVWVDFAHPSSRKIDFHARHARYGVAELQLTWAPGSSTVRPSVDEVARRLIRQWTTNTSATADGATTFDFDVDAVEFLAEMVASYAGGFVAGYTAVKSQNDPTTSFGDLVTTVTKGTVAGTGVVALYGGGLAHKLVGGAGGLLGGLAAQQHVNLGALVKGIGNAIANLFSSRGGTAIGDSGGYTGGFADGYHDGWSDGRSGGYYDPGGIVHDGRGGFNDGVADGYFEGFGDGAGLGEPGSGGEDVWL